MSFTMDLLHLAKKVNNYAEDATGGGKWTTDKIYQATVPTGKRWYLIGGVVNRNVSSTMTIYHFDSADKIVDFYSVEGAGTGKIRWPEFNQAHAANGFIGILDEDEYVKMTFATSQDSGSSASCVVLEVALP